MCVGDGNRRATRRLRMPMEVTSCLSRGPDSTPLQKTAAFSEIPKLAGPSALASIDLAL